MKRVETEKSFRRRLEPSGYEFEEPFTIVGLTFALVSRKTIRTPFLLSN